MAKKTQSPYVAPKTRGARLMEFRRLLPLYILLLPAVVYMLIFKYYPMYGAQIAFRNYKLAKGILGSDWVGLKWFLKFVNDYQFSMLLRNTLTVSVYGLVVGFLMQTLLSLSMNCMRGKYLKRTIQTITYMPHFISTVVLVGIIISFTNPNKGALSLLIQKFGGTNRDIMGMAPAIPHIYVWSDVWQNAGWNTILFIATLTSVDPELHEAAIIDGATRVKRIWHIDLPMLLPTMVIVLILNAGKIMSVGYEKMLLMQNDLNLGTSQIISTYVYNQGIASATPKYSYAAAIDLFNSVINFVLIVAVNQFAKRVNGNSLW